MKTMIAIAVAAGLTLTAFFWNQTGKGGAGLPVNGKKAANTEISDELAMSTPGIMVKNRWQMPAILTEISGLSYIDNDQFACVQDEVGKVFIYNTKTSSVEKEIPFAGAGDYEGLAIENTTAWVVRADGRLFEISNYNTQPSVKEHETHLTAEHNVEGLCFDSDNNRLLLAVKDGDRGNPGFKGIYSFDLDSRKIIETPVIKIDLGDKIFHSEKTGNTKKKSGGGSKKKNGAELKPSAIAVHPLTKDIYITDGPKGKLLVMSANGEVKKLYQLDGREFSQPEGITFNNGGEMFISNEGSKAAGNILNVEINDQ